MVEVRIIRIEGLPGHCTVWRRKKGRKFAKRIGKQRRDLLTNFVVQNATVPVNVSILLLDRVRPYAAYPIQLGKSRHAGFVVGQFFLLLRVDDLKESTKTTLGERNLTQEELVNAVIS